TAGETPRGDTVFRDLVSDPPTSENEFILLWKLYISVLIAREMRTYDIRTKEAKGVYDILERIGLLEREITLVGILRRVQQVVRNLLRSIDVESTITIDPLTGAPVATGKITLKEPVGDERKRGDLSIDNLLANLNDALNGENWNVWILLDRLDVAFIDNHNLEANALRALMRVYNDVKAYERIFLKIFIREDIWKRITIEGFREASHIIRYVLLDWNQNALLNLVMRRILSNDMLVDEYNLDRRDILGSIARQEELFRRLFPAQVEQGPQKALTFKWMITRCADGTRKTAPRELIHLLNCLREQEAERLEQGGVVPPGEQIFDRSVFKLALPTVSNARLNQYIYAEYPNQRQNLE